MRASLTAAALTFLLWAPSVLADWTAHADFTSCPRSRYPRTEGHEAPVATEAECRAQIDRARRGDPAVCIKYSCEENGAGSSGASAAPGHQLDSTIERAISAGVSGDISGADAVGLTALGVLGNALLAGTASSPEQQQQAEAQRQYQQQQAAEQARQQAIAEEERKNRLLGEMQGVEQGTDLQLMTDDRVEQTPVSSAGAGGELALMTGEDDTRGIMGKRKAPVTLRNQPPATRVSQGPYTTPVTPPARQGSGNERGSPAPANDKAPVQVAIAGPTDRESFGKGREDGEACKQRSSGTHCGVLRDGEALRRCQQHYNNGYDAGAQKMQRDLSAKGAAAGARDKGKANSALTYDEARGSCGNIFVNAYNGAFR